MKKYIDTGIIIDVFMANTKRNAKLLAKKHPELKGLDWNNFLEKAFDMELAYDFITLNEIFEILNPKEK